MSERKTAIQATALIDLQSLRFSVDALGRLSACDELGNCFEDIKPVRLFPLSKPSQWISLVDAAGKEIICIDDPAKLSPENQAILTQN